MKSISRRQFVASSIAVMGLLSLTGCGSKADTEYFSATGDALCKEVQAAFESGITVDGSTWHLPSKATVSVAESHTGENDYWIQVNTIVPDSMGMDNAREGIKCACAAAILLANNPTVERLVYNCHNESGTSLYQIIYASPWPTMVGTQQYCIDASAEYREK